MSALGEELVAEIRRRFPDTGFVLAGYSFGASMAIETARQLEEAGISVHRLLLIAPMPENIFRIGPLRLQLDGLRRPLTELSLLQALRLYLRENHPFRMALYRRAWRRLAIEPWRRILCGVGRLRHLLGLPLTPRILHADIRVERFRLHSRWQPEAVRTPTVIFNAQEAFTDAASTWRPFFEGPLDVVAIPDPHLGEESAEAARRVILRHLESLGDR